MSLLLDALKKSGSGSQSAAESAPALALEELPNKTAAAAFPGSGSIASSRSTGENLFAAKKSPARKKFRYTLGIIPTAMIIGLVLGTAGGIYVWLEIQPPKAVQRHSPPPAVAAYTAPVVRPLPALALPPEAMPEAEVQTRVTRAAPLSQSRVRAGKLKQAPLVETVDGIQIQRQLETDGIYSTLTTAYQAYQNGDLATAWQRYREVLLKDAKNRDALLGMAAIAQQQGQDAAAIQYYRQVLALDPRDPVAQAGMSGLSTGDAASKETRLKLGLAQSPQSATLHFALGNLYAEHSRWGEAQQAYFNALRLEPANAQFAFNLATSLDHLGQRKLAAQYYTQALQTDITGNSGFDRVQTQQRLKQLLAH